MENGDLISLLETMLGPATAGVAPPRHAREYQEDAQETYLDAAEESVIAPGAIHPSMTGLLSASMPIGIAIVDRSTLSVVRLNDMLLRMLGVQESAERTVGLPLDHVAPALGAPDLLSALSQVAVTGIVYSAILADGMTAPAGQPIYRRWTVGPLRQGARTYDTLLITALDVTEQVITRRRMEEAVAAAQEQARRLQEHSSFMQERIRQVEEQASARLQQAIKQHEERVRVAAEQAGHSFDQLRQLEQQLRLTPDQKRQLESAALLANDGARAQLEQSQRELEEARQEIERLRREEGPASLDADAPSAHALASLTRELTAGSAPDFDQAAQIIAEAFGDTCGIFLANSERRLTPVAFYHREPQIAAQLSSFYTQYPLEPAEGLVGQALRQGIGSVRAAVVADDIPYILPGLGEGAQALGITSAACAPLRGTLEPMGVVLVLTTRRANGESERSLDEGALGALNLFAGTIALAAQNIKLNYEVRAAEAQREALFAGMSDGVAIYDRMGRLRHVNLVAEKLLSPPPAAQPGARPILQGYLDERGAPLTGSALPWMRVLRGEASQGAIDRVIATWGGGLRRSLLLTATPVRDAAGLITHAIVILRPDQPQGADGQASALGSSAPSRGGVHGDAPDRPVAGYCEAGETCARVARAFGAARKRRIEVRLPQRKVLLSASEVDAERAIVALIEAAAVTFPASAPLQMSLVVEPEDTATSRPRRYSAGPAPEFSAPASDAPGRRLMATLQLTGSQAGATTAAAPFLEEARARATAFDGVAWIFEDGGRETLFLLRAPVARIER